MKTTLMTLALLLALPVFAQDTKPTAQPKPVRAARSVHMWHDGLPATHLVYMEAQIAYSAPGSYFMIIGFTPGYMGIQELPDGRKVGLFSVWEPGDPHDYAANPNKVDANERAQVLYAGSGVTVSRFGGEGTGGKSMFPLNWKTGDTVRCAVESHLLSDGWTAYTGWIFNEETQAWRRLATFATLAADGKSELRGIHNFVEDFWRNGNSIGWVRKAYYRMGAAYDGQKWVAPKRYGFSADSSSQQLNLNADIEGDAVFLQTGGMTANTGIKLWGFCKVPQIEVPPATEKARALLLEAVAQAKLDDAKTAEAKAASSTETK